MTRPLIVRADTIDLQNPDAPSAKDHDRQHLHPTESTAPHQASTLREVAHETAEEQSRSPRLSWSSGFLIEEPRHVSDDDADDLAAGVRGRMAHQDQEDHLAIAQNGGVSSSDEGEDDGDLDDDMMDRISSSPSIEDEDIDFDFVYALHTFVATVEGQANATKGDTMVLLDDSNSYWWLVRVVKDSSIGYLPAEHIETPTERLARWNKHRNVDLSAAMLGDNPQKQKSTLKSIRKRWKTVTFTEPTYVDYSDIDYSTDEEDIEELFSRDATSAQLQDEDRDEEDEQRQKEQDQDQSAKQLRHQEEEQRRQEEAQASSDDDLIDDRAKVEPLKTQSTKSEAKEETKEVKSDAQQDDDDDEIETRDSTELLGGGVGMVGRTRNGKIRNTDSFFKDETVETKKITLTPNLLRDDGAARPSTDSIVTKDKGRPSLETKMEKEFVSDKDSKKNKKEKEKKEKEKKPSAIRNFFSRKDKKRTSEDDEESLGKRSMDIMSEPRDSEDPMADDQEKPQRTPSKLQKQQPRTEPMATRKNSTGSSQQKKSPEMGNNFSETRTNNVSNVPPSTMRIVDPETQEAREVPSHQQQQQSPRDAAQRDENPAAVNNMVPRTAGSTASATPQNLAQARSRMDLDDSDSSDAAEALLEEIPQKAPAQGPISAVAAVPEGEQASNLRPHVPGAFPDSHQSPTTGTPAGRGLSPDAAKDRLSESPVEVSPVSLANQSYPPGLVADAAPSPSPDASPSPDFIGRDEGLKGDEDDTQQQPSWDDTKLRAFFDEGKHVRDLLAVVYDTSDVEPADSNAGSLFREQNAKLAEITTQLDNMLGDWLARKQRLRGTL